VLESALEADAATGSHLLSRVLIARKERELEIVKSIASRRSGARGKDARYDEIKGEAELEDLKNRWVPERELSISSIAVVRRCVATTSMKLTLEVVTLLE
jgi:hypothetical protein